MKWKNKEYKLIDEIDKANTCLGCAFEKTEENSAGGCNVRLEIKDCDEEGKIWKEVTDERK